MKNQKIFNELLKQANYALNSKSLTHETYGAAKMAFSLSAITKEQFYELNEILIKNGINNPAASLK